MKTYTKMLLAAAVVAPGAMIAASQANAQAVAVADPQAAMANSKVWDAAQKEVATVYKTQIDQAKTRADAIAAELQPLYKRFDTNNDGQLTQAEAEAARARKAPEFAQIEAKEKAGQEELGRITLQPARARAYAEEQIANRVNEAVSNVVKARQVKMLVRPAAIFFTDPSNDITPAITAELDRLLPKVSITPPANWQPGQQQGAPGAAAPAPTAAPAATRPATTTPAKAPERPR